MRILPQFLIFLLLQSASGEDLPIVFDDTDRTIVIHNQKEGKTLTYNPKRSKERFVVCSTFKIPNSLIALETGAVKDLNEVFKFDPKKHRLPLRSAPNYNRDQTLPSAFKVSALWTYQEIAKRVGNETYQTHLKSFEYGNCDTSGPIEDFWLSRLKVSAEEQVRFLRRFHANEYKLKTDTVEAVKKMMLLEEGKSYRLYGKTGTGKPDDQWIGWLVGFVEAKDNTWFFALNTKGKNYKEIKTRRRETLEKSFAKLGIDLKKS